MNQNEKRVINLIQPLLGFFFQNCILSILFSYILTDNTANEEDLNEIIISLYTVGTMGASFK